MSKRRNIITICDCPAPTVEVDPGAGAMYVRFRRGKVARTEADTRPDGIFIGVDFNAAGEVMGVEFVGGDELKITAVLKAARVRVKNLRVADMAVKLTPAS